MAQANRTAARGTPSVKCIRALACTLVIAHTLLHATEKAEALGGASYARRTARQLAQEVDPGASHVIEDRFIVVLKDDAGNAAADALVQRVQASLAAVAAAAAASDLQQPGEDAVWGAAQAAAQPVAQSVRVLGTLGSTRAQEVQPPSDPAENSPSSLNAAATAASHSDTTTNSSSSNEQDSAAAGFEALLLAAPPSAVEYIRQTGLVMAVFRDRVVVPQSRIFRRSLSSSSSVGSEGSEQVLADAPDAALASDLSLAGQQGQQQLQDEQQQQQPNQESPALNPQTADKEQQQQQQPDQQQHPGATEAELQAQQLGNTNRATDSPQYRGSVPTFPLQPVLFAPTPANNGLYSRPNRRRRTAPRPSASLDEDRLNALQRLRAPFVPGPAPAPAPEPTPAPAPAPSTGNVPWPVEPDAGSNQQNPVVQQMKQLLRRQGLAAGEQVPAGIAFIEAATAAAVPYTGGAMQGIQQQVTVAVVDSGVDANHPDLVYAGGKSWVQQPSRRMPGDLTDPGVDFYGHGTHVAGIIGARNTGRGVIGVAPGMPVFSLKVLDGSGQGALSDVLAAVRWAAGREGQSYNIKVINLSIAAFVSSDADDADDTLRIVCQIFKEASDAGVLVVAAAGNYRDSLLNYVPAACPTVATVTAIDPSSQSASAFSNYLPADAPAADKARVMAAPGSGVLSTMSIQKERSRYRELSGTSQASPHVAGIAATCIQSGACPLGSTGMQKLAIIQAAAIERMTQRQPYGFRGDPVSSKGAASQQYYGFLAWSKFWDG